MPVIAVINRKGGSGKSTLATHLAAWLSHQGRAVMLGDVDRQQSTCAWLKRRDTSLPAIVPWALDQKNVLKVPPGVTHVVLDTPGGMHGFELAKVVMSADALGEWAKALNVPFLGVLREAQQYVKSLDSGMTMLDLPGNAHAADLLQWDPTLK